MPLSLAIDTTAAATAAAVLLSAALWPQRTSLSTAPRTYYLPVIAC